MMKKIVALGVISLFVMTSFAALPCISATITANKSNEIVALDQDETYSITWSTKGNPPLPPVMWTENFSTFYIPTPQDPDGDDVYYWIDWGDGTVEDWIGPYASGVTVCISHVWIDEGTYQIKVKAKDQDGESKCAVYSLTLTSDLNFFGVEIGYVDITYTFTIYWKNCEYEYCIYIDWGDGEVEDWMGPFAEQPISFSHTWSLPGEYILRLKFKDIYGNESDWITFIITILPPENNPPSAPVINGPKRGRPKTYECTLKPGTYNYTFKATDPDGDNVSYYINWGDGTCEGWIGWYASGEEVIRNHIWDKKGTYTIRAKAKDIYGAEGPWGTLWIWFSGSSQQPTNSLFLQFLQQFPILQKILVYLIK